MWNQREVVFDVIHLLEAHTGQYLADRLLEVINDFRVTHAVHTISRDNVYANDIMLKISETVAAEGTSPFQPWPFTVEKGDVRWMGHIINLAMQDALKTLKADPDEDPNSYHLSQGQARLLTPLSLQNREAASIQEKRLAWLCRKAVTQSWE